MSRSYRKTPIFSNGSDKSEAWYKQVSHQQERRQIHQLVNQGEEELPDEKNWGNPWGGPKDGKHYWGKADPKYMRK